LTVSTRTSRRIALATGIHYNVLEWAGPSDGTLTYVLVHGFTDVAFAWRRVAEQLATHAHVIAPDLRGHGDSDWIGGGGYYYFMDYVADLDDVIRQCARTRVVLVGHSMGGSVCSYFAGTRPDRLQALALLEGLGPPDQSAADGPTRTAMWIDAWRAARTKSSKVMATLDDAVARLRKHDDLLSGELARELAEHGTKKVDGGFAWKHDPLHATFGPYPYRLDTAMKYWAKITCPTLIVDGADSKLNLSFDERAKRRASFVNHRYEVIANAGHAIQRHQPAALADLLLSLS
jgi:pimeloyl-ACP methyl ester carboxylesterase